MTYTEEQFEEAIEILFDNLDTRNWEDSFLQTVFGSREPNTLYKVTVDDKIEYLREVVCEYVGSLKRAKESK